MGSAYFGFVRVGSVSVEEDRRAGSHELSLLSPRAATVLVIAVKAILLPSPSRHSRSIKVVSTSVTNSSQLEVQVPLVKKELFHSWRGPFRVLFFL